ncbi:B- and T-lymphocyte attenuator-like [Cebidichthys violaceus]|uniref:B- and T-lymphocyte attenuator-like n=1 Tax=Cebidichthys violaceus TaxID=271503 RepID=UPI0035C9E4BE
MRPNCCLTILRVSVCAALLLTLDADSEDSDCEVEVKVSKNTVYEAVLGEDLQIHCTVEFCSGSPPTVSWYKSETTDVPVNVSSSSHIKTEWTLLKDLEGRSFLIFQKVRRNDSGEYQCQVGGSISHYIQVSVHGELTTVALMTSEPDLLVTETATFWPFVYRVVGITVIFILMLSLCVASRRMCKGQSRDTPSRQPSHDALPPSPIYENSQQCPEINPLS